MTLGRWAMICAVGLMGATPAAAKWNYCYTGTPPAGVNDYVEMPPRPFGFEMALLPHTFRKLCNGDHEPEAAHIRRLVAEALECSEKSDLAQRIEGLLTATPAQLLQGYFDLTSPPNGPAWTRVCLAADRASVAHLSFADTWYFDSPDAVADSERMKELITRLTELSAALRALGPN